MTNSEITTLTADIPSLPTIRGKHVVVTGGNAGLGYFAAEQLASAGARITLASRNAQKAAAAIRSIQNRIPSAEVRHQQLDLADLASVNAAVAELTSAADNGAGIDVLIANAGLLGAKNRAETVDGFELMFGTNVLGHFALIGGLLPVLERGDAGRIVSLGSISHEFFRLDLNDLQSVDNYSSFRSYGRSKLAVMTLAFELDRRLRVSGRTTRSIVAHPGYAIDILAPERLGVVPQNTSSATERALYSAFAQGKHVGAEPISFAAVDEYLRGGEYVGPRGWKQLAGPPAVVKAKPWARDRMVAAQLWDLAEEFTQTPIRFPTTGAPAETSAAAPGPDRSRTSSPQPRNDQSRGRNDS